MNRPRHHFPARDESIEATAAAWLAERDDGLSAEDAAAFAAWRTADPRHEAAVRRLETAWASLQRLREFRPEARVHPDRDLLARPLAAHGLRFAPWVAPAALAACLTLVAAFFWFRADGGAMVSSPPAHYVTTVGGYQRMTLSDGSIIDLNANTELREQFTADERRVALVRGEATFQVTKNPSRPFVVVAGGVAVRAVGTAFNVRLQSDKVDVLVTEGRVRIESRVAAATPLVPELNVGQTVSVPTAAVVSPVVAAPVVHNVSPAIIREELAWQEPKLVFVETPLAEVVRQFNARNRVQLEIADPELAALPVGGSFRADSVEAFVRLITSNEQIEAVRAPGEHIVLRRAR